MGRTSASHKASGGNDSRPGARPSNGTYPRPAGANADGAPTLRNLVPWRDMEKKLAERLAAKAAAGELSGELSKERLGVEPRAPSSKPPPWRAEIEAAPDSGVRASAESEPPRDLTYSVYTLEDLEARAQVRGPRMSMAFAPTPAPQPSRWVDVGKSALALVRAFLVCIRAPKPRPRVMDVCRVPLTAFLTDLKSALAALPWKKVAIGVGVVFGAVVALLALVLTAAELTDDLKPRRSASATSGADISTRHVVEASTPATRPTSMVVSEPATTPSAPANAPTVETASIEIEEDVTEPPAAAAKPVAPKSAAPKPNASAVGSAKKPLLPKKKGVEIFIP